MTATKTKCTLINKVFNPDFAFNFSPNNKAPVGLILSLKFTIGGQTLEPDIAVINPESPAATLDVCAVLDRAYWSGEDNEPILIEGRVTPKNRGILKQALTNGGASIEMDFVVYDYDESPSARKYYVSFSSDAVAKPFMLSENYQHNVQDLKDTIIQQPTNFPFNMSFHPKTEEAITLSCASSATIKWESKFGTAIKA